MGRTFRVKDVEHVAGIAEPIITIDVGRYAGRRYAWEESVSFKQQFFDPVTS